MQKLTIQQSIEMAKENPDSGFASALRKEIESGNLDAPARKQGYDLSSFGRNNMQSDFQKFAKGAEVYTPGGKLARGVASSFTLPMATKSLDEITSSVNSHNQILIDKMREAKAKGEDVTKYKEALKGNQKLLQSSIDALDTEVSVTPTTGQVVGGGAELITMAVPGSTTGSLTRKIGVGAATGYAGDVATNLASGKTGGEALIPGVGTAIGAGMPIIGAGVGIGVKALKEVAPALVGKISKLVKIPGKVVSAAGEIVSDLVGTKQGAVSSLVARSLKLAPVEDISRISNLIGEDIGTKMTSHNLIKNTPAQTEDAIKKFTKDNYNLKNDLISLVDEQFSKQEIPEIQDLVEMLSEELKKTKSVEYKQALQRLTDMGTAEMVSLEDVNFVRSVFDDIESVYTRGKTVRDDLLASDKANMANKLREFVDSRVAEVYPDAHVREISKNIMFGKAMEDAIIKRSGKFDTQSPLALSDLFVLGIPSDPVTGVALLATKKIAGSSPIKLRVAQAIASTLGDSGVEAKKLKELSAMVTEELRKSFDFVDKTK
jgi:hypothetical protein